MKAQLKVLAILFLLLLGIGIYALPSLKVEAKAILASTRTKKTPSPPQKPVHIPTDTTAQRILLIGDSMNEGITRRFSAWCENSGHELHTVIWYGSSTKSWASSNRIKLYIKKIHPTYIIISLGSNELFVKDAVERAKYIRSITEAVGTSPYVWIGPPNWKEDTGINAAIAREVGSGRFYESRNLTLERGKDHRHPTMASAAAWTDSVASWLSSGKTAHPIRLTRPTEQNGHWQKRLTLIPQE